MAGPVRVEHPPDLGLCLPRTDGDLGLGRRVLEAKHQVTDDVPIALDDHSGRQPLRLGEGRPVGLDVLGQQRRPPGDGGKSPVRPGGLGIASGGRTEREPLGADEPGECMVPAIRRLGSSGG